MVRMLFNKVIIENIALKVKQKIVIFSAFSLFKQA